MLNSDSKSQKDETHDHTKHHQVGRFESKSSRGNVSTPSGPTSTVADTKEQQQQQQQHGPEKRSNYYSVESFLALVLLTVSLLVLPLVLPPLPPPPSLLLLLPIGILVVLMILAFMHSDIRNIGAFYM